MSRRGRAIGFLFGALAAAATAAAIAQGYGNGLSEGYGELRPVVVAAAPLAPGRTIGPRQATADLETRRVPARFVPPGALRVATAALGLEPVAAIPAGAYLLASQLRPPRSGRTAAAGLAGGRRPVQITVSGAEALLLAGEPPVGARVDVVVTAEPTVSGPGRTYVAAAAVPLLALVADSPEAGAGATAAATLGLTRRQALRLIAADSFARRVTLLPVG